MSNKFTTFKKIDKNRFRKIYPVNPKRPVSGFTSDKGLVVETLTVEFNNSSRKSFNLEGRYSALPVVVISSYTVNSGDNNNVNVFISSMGFSGDVVQIVASASAPFTGLIAVQVIEIQ